MVCNQQMQKMYSLILLLLINYVQAQQDLCLCSCCIGQSCSPSYIGAISLPSCTLESCRINCRGLSPQCQSDYPNGQVLPQCIPTGSTPSPPYSCRCDCCRTGTPTCTPTFIGYSAAYACQPGPCSISCATQYPGQCVSDQTGQTSGTCIGAITTTTTSTTTASTTRQSYSGNTCSCMCCQSGPSCSPNIQVGIITGVSQCSSAACTTACQNQYPTSCPSYSYYGYTNGVCLVPTSGNTRCQCYFCGIIIFLLTILLQMPILHYTN